MIHENIYDLRDYLVASDLAVVDLGHEETDNSIVLRIGARGSLRSIYRRNPDSNLMELSNCVN